MLPSEIKVSYTILTHNESESLQELLNQLLANKTIWDEIIIVDDFSTDEDCLKVLEWAKQQNNTRVFQNKLNNDFAQQKNFANSKCINEWIFNIDSDELLDDNLMKSFKEVLALNPDAEMFRFPRVNKVKGITIAHTNQWGWGVSSLPTEYEEKVLPKSSEEYIMAKSFNLIISEDSNSKVKFLTPIVNWPDPQTRLYKNKEDIRWERPVHESIVGFKTFCNFPSEKKYSILHYKDVQKQEAQNNYYNNLQGR